MAEEKLLTFCSWACLTFLIRIPNRWGESWILEIPTAVAWTEDGINQKMHKVGLLFVLGILIRSRGGRTALQMNSPPIKKKNETQCVLMMMIFGIVFNSMSVGILTPLTEGSGNGFWRLKGSSKHEMKRGTNTALRRWFLSDFGWCF